MSRFPRGLDFEVFPAVDLRRADECALDTAEREHVTPYVRAHVATLTNIVRTPDSSAYALTLDTYDDLNVVRRLIEEFGAQSLDADAIVGPLSAHPDIAAMNAHVEQKKLGE